jgi:hypothetical protein
MSHAPEDIRTCILASTAVSSLVGTRCHYNQLPQASAYPHVWFRIASDTEERTLDGTGGLHEAAADLECVGSSESSAQNVADAVKSRLDGYKGSMGNMTCQAAFLRDKDDDYIPYSNQSDDGAHVVAFTLSLWYTT